MSFPNNSYWFDANQWVLLLTDFYENLESQGSLICDYIFMLDKSLFDEFSSELNSRYADKIAFSFDPVPFIVLPGCEGMNPCPMAHLKMIRTD